MDVQITIGRYVLPVSRHMGHKANFHYAQVLLGSYFLFPFKVASLLRHSSLILDLMLQRTSSEIFKENSRIGKRLLLHKESQKAYGKNWR